MAKKKLPVTQAVRALKGAKVTFEGHLYDYEERGGAAAGARELGVDEYIVIKTLVFQDEQKNLLVVLMHGNRQVSTKNLARHLGAKTIEPCSAEVAQRNTGYVFGGTSPFGLKKRLPIYVERTILDLPLIYINGGKQGFLVSLCPCEMEKALIFETISVAIESK